ncbi:hypothetical protein [Halorubrum halodurans]|uniref:hypothetical protein n=1 Tax=Halorubrum halodurans TaxID=1383851 RepID=UPI00117B5E12|nr:hypothetical protein [Halorubrum halodurans]
MQGSVTAEKLRGHYSKLLLAFGLSYVLILAKLSNRFPIDIIIGGLYILFSLVISISVLWSIERNTAHNISKKLRRYKLADTRFQISVFLLCLPIIYFTSYGVVATVLCSLLLTISFISTTYVQEDNKLAIVPPILIVAIILIRKYISTFFYFGDRDIISHVGITNKILSTGGINSINSLYRVFPGYHIEMAIVSLVSGLNSHTTIMMVGIIATCAVVLLMFLFSNRLMSNNRTSYLISYLSATSWFVLFFGNYFIPQSLAVVLTTCVLLIGYQSHPFTAKISQRSTILGLIILFTLTISHHLTVILLLVPLSVVVLVEALLRYGEPSENNSIFLYLMFLIPITYWSFLGVFIPVFFRLAQLQIRLTFGIITPQTQPTISTYIFGTPPAEPNLVFSLITPQLILSTIILAFLFLGIRYTLERQDWTLLPFVITSIVGSIIIFPTPLGISSRFAYPWILFLLLVAGVGVVHARSVSPKQAIALLLIIGVVSPVAVADDQQHINPGIEEQVSFNQQEYSQLQSASGHITENIAGPATTLRLVDISLRTLFGVEKSQIDAAPAIGEEGIKTDSSYLIYRSNWTNHPLEPNYPEGISEPTVFVGEEWLSDSVYSANQIYDNGGVGIVWNRSGASLNP